VSGPSTVRNRLFTVLVKMEKRVERNRRMSRLGPGLFRNAVLILG